MEGTKETDIEKQGAPDSIPQPIVYNGIAGIGGHGLPPVNPYPIPNNYYLPQGMPQTAVPPPQLNVDAPPAT